MGMDPMQAFGAWVRRLMVVYQLDLQAWAWRLMAACRPDLQSLARRFVAALRLVPQPETSQVRGSIVPTLHMVEEGRVTHEAPDSGEDEPEADECTAELTSSEVRAAMTPGVWEFPHIRELSWLGTPWHHRAGSWESSSSAAGCP